MKYTVVCMIPDRFYSWWSGNGWTESEGQAQTWESLEEATKVYKQWAHLSRGVSKVYHVRLLDGAGKILLERKAVRG